MDRIIKFRGKNKDIGWVYGQLAYDINGNTYIIQEVELDSSYGLEETILFATMWYRVDKETVGQFTEVYDKCKKEIYTGDILEVGDIRKKVVITFQDGEFGYLYENTCINPKYQNPKVIGNIYDNKNLLEAE